MPFNQSLRKNSHVLWTISVVQDNDPSAQTKSEFSEMAQDVLSTDTIDRVTLCLADNLQRFRLMIKDGISEEEATKECQKMALLWHNDNSATLDKLKDEKKLSLLTWQEFLEWPDYANTVLELEKWYKENRDFRNDVDGRIRQARESIGNDAKISNPIEQTVLLKRYLFEECAYQKFAASKGFNYEIYKTPMSKAMRRVKRNTDFVPSGVMVEIYFTQFNPSAKKNRQTNENQIMPKLDENTFSSSLFKKAPIKATQNIDANICSKFGKFIEKTLELLPPLQQEKAIEELLKFTTEEIIPLCYKKPNNVASMMKT